MNENDPIRRGRPPGAKNKPNTCLVRLCDLNRLFNGEALIEVSTKYGALISTLNQEVPVLPTPIHEKSPTILDLSAEPEPKKPMELHFIN